MALTDGLMAYYSLEEASGTRYDSWQGRNATVRTNGAVVDRNVSAIVGNGTDGYDQWDPREAWVAGNYLCWGWGTHANRWFPIYDKSITVAFWMKAGSKLGTLGIYKDAGLFGMGDTYSPTSAVFSGIWRGDTNKIGWLTYDRAGTAHELITASTLSSYRSAWHFYVFTYNISTGAKRITIDTVEKASGTTSATTCGRNGTYGTPLYIGAHLSSNGGMTNPNPSAYDEFAWWSRPLSDTEISWLYNSGVGRTFQEVTNKDQGLSFRS